VSDIPAVMVTIKELAELAGVSKQAVSRKVQQLVAEHGVPVEHDTRGRVARVSLAHWQRYHQDYGNPAKQRPRAAEPFSSREWLSDSFDEARRRNEWLKHDTAMIEMQEKAGQLVRLDKLTEALGVVGREIKAIIYRLPNRADDLAISVGREGTSGLRTALRSVAFDMSTLIADQLASIAEAAPESDRQIEGEQPDASNAP
jgi:phage terminase Nu1 subunit (DNA packaging protein)